MRDQISLDSETAAFCAMEVWNVAAMLQRRGVDPTNALACCNISKDDSFDQSKRISFDQLLSFYTMARNDLDAGFLEALGDQQHVTAFGVVGFAMLSSATVGEAIETAIRFWPLVNTKYRIEQRSKKDRVYFELHEMFPIPKSISPYLTTLELKKFEIFFGDLCEEGAEEMEVVVDGPGLQLMPSISPLFRSRVRTGAQNSISVPVRLLAQSQKMANQFTHQAAIEDCIKLVNTFQRFPILIRKIRNEFSSLSHGAPSLHELATKLNMSDRTLRRRLNDLGTSYNLILEDVRLGMAKKHLQEPGITTDHVAALLGYSETANFRHAFRRWTGNSPQAFRRQQRENYHHAVYA